MTRADTFTAYPRADIDTHRHIGRVNRFLAYGVIGNWPVFRRDWSAIDTRYDSDRRQWVYTGVGVRDGNPSAKVGS